MLLTILSAVVCGFVAWVVYLRIKINKMAELSEKLPGPKTFPFLGNALDLGGLKANAQPKDFFDATIKLSKEYGPVFRLWVGTNLIVVLNDPKYVEVILSSNTELDKANNYRFTLPWIGYGLLTATGSKWKRHRRIITPTFHFKILEDFVDVFNSNGKKMIEKLAMKANGPEIDIYPYISLCALDIISETAMGISIKAQDYEDSEFVRATRDMTRVVVWRSFKPLLQWDVLFHLLPTGKVQRDALQVLHATTAKVIKARKADYQNKRKLSSATQNGKPVDDNDVGVKKRKAFLDMLLDTTQDNSLTDEELREEVDTFMFEGHDTTTSGISFTLSCLSHHQDVQDKAYEEQEEIFGSSDREATHQDLQEMKYLERVIKETQRLFPSVPMYGRTINNDLKVGEYTLPKGANITISPIFIHRNEKYFPNPEKFDPERFTPENSQGRHPYQYIPFSAGPRNCIGQKFAMLEMKATVSKMLRNFKMLPGSTTNKFEELVGELVLKNIHGIKMRLVQRK